MLNKNKKALTLVDVLLVIGFMIFTIIGIYKISVNFSEKSYSPVAIHDDNNGSTKANVSINLTNCGMNDVLTEGCSEKFSEESMSK